MKSIIKIINKIKGNLLYKKISKRNIYFIVSTGRTGTNFMETFLSSASDQVFCVHEPRPDLFNISIEKLREKKNKEIIIEDIKNARSTILSQFLQSGKTTFVESNPFASFLLPELEKVFPKAKFVIIYRDLDTYLLSALNKSPLGNGLNNFYAETDARTRPRPSDFTDDIYEEQWSVLSRAQKITWYWNKCNLFLKSFAEENESRILELKFEELFNKDNETKKKSLEKLFAFTNIETSSSKLETLLERSTKKRNQTEEKFYSSLSDLSEDELTWIDTVTKELRQKLNYK